MPNVLLIGEPMVMFVADTVAPLEENSTFHRFLAGAEVNVAIGLSRLQHEVSYMTKLGDDPFAKYVINCLKNDNISTEFISLDVEHPTGFQLKGKVESGDPPVVYFRKNSAASHITEEDIDRMDFTEIRHVHVTGIFPALSAKTKRATMRLLERAKSSGAFISFDPNLRPTLWENTQEMTGTLNAIAPWCDLILPGLSEGQTLTGSSKPEDIAAFYHSLGVETVIIKMGSDGAYASAPDESFYQEGFPVTNVVDTVGAGDAFAVGIISARLEGLSLEESLIRANAIGSMQVQTPGDNDGLPTRQQLESFLKKKQAI